MREGLPLEKVIPAMNRFDQIAAEWDSSPRRLALAEALAAGVLRAVAPRPDWRVLDFGAGTGLLALRLSFHVAEVVAVDTSREMLRALEEKLAAGGLGNITARMHDLLSEPWPAAEFDLIVSSMALHHVRDTALLLERFAAALVPGGWIALADLDSEDGTFHGEVEDVFHRGFDRAALGDLIARAGFGDVAFRTAHRVPKVGSDGVEREYPVFLATGRTPLASDLTSSGARR